MKILIETIPHSKQRYNTVGDYWTAKDGTVHIKVSNLYSSNYEFLVAMHELVEAYLCSVRGISEETIDKFDMTLNSSFAEPGDSPKCPYYAEHQFASAIERLLANELDLKWCLYEYFIDNVMETYESEKKSS